MAKPVDKGQYTAFLKNGGEHEACGSEAIAGKRYNAAVTNYSIAIINYLDALSVNRFGKDLSSGNHEAAPSDLLRSLNGAGITDFKGLAVECGAVLRLKNLASYQSKEINSKDATQARKIAQKVKSYVEDRIDRKVGA